MTSRGTRPGALVVSLDFELYWGIRDTAGAQGRAYARALGARRVIPKLLALFEEFEIAATWATVGLLFARTREEVAQYAPAVRPRYRDTRLDPYTEELGPDEDSDPVRYAASLIDQIRRTRRQEIGSHTFSHYYCNEPGQDGASFAADLAAACAIAEARGIHLRSIVFPRNQHNPAYDAILLSHGIEAYRGLPDSWAWRFHRARESATPTRRAIRLLDTYVNVAGHETQAWDEVRQPNGLANIRASAMLRGYSHARRHLEPLRLRRILDALEHAARHHRIYHLWWHPHNFSDHHEQNLQFLRRVFERFMELRRDYGMVSITMQEAAAYAASGVATTS